MEVVHRGPKGEAELSPSNQLPNGGAPVNIHKNARLTPISRARLVQRIEAGERVSEMAAAFQVSRRTAHKWVRRWREEGEAGLADRSSRPHRSPRRLARARRRQIERLRRKRFSSLEIAERLKIPVSTVVVTVRRLGLARLPRRIPPPPVQRYERERPGELVHLDIKKLGRIGRIGHRIHGDRRRRIVGIGWEYLHVCIDDATRLAYGEVLDDEVCRDGDRLLASRDGLVRLARRAGRTGADR
jgi:transposase